MKKIFLAAICFYSLVACNDAPKQEASTTTTDTTASAKPAAKNIFTITNKNNVKAVFTTAMVFILSNN